MITISKMFKFDTAHRLYKYSGKCANIHGHTYKMEVFVNSDRDINRKTENTYPGFVIDFGELKDDVNMLVNDLDHSLILSSNDPLLDILRHQTKLYVMENNPTVENMCIEFYNTLRRLGVKICRIKIWETETSMAEYSGE
jgi:6-pyruvoyltetrahydropterin/6-carboxytetrahydropterin synthase